MTQQLTEPEQEGRHAEPPCSKWHRSNPGRIWRLILSMGKDDSYALNRWKIWIWWSQPRPLAGRLKAIVQLTMAPLLIGVEAYSAIRKHGHNIEMHYKVGHFAQYKDAFFLRMATGLPCIQYYQLQLYLPERRAKAVQFITETGKPLQVLAERMKSDKDFGIFLDKREFSKWCGRHNIPTVGIFIEFQDRPATLQADEPTNGLPAIDVISKPTNWESGKGVRVWRHALKEGTSTWRSGTCLANSYAELKLSIMKQARETGRPFIVQPCLKNHPIIQSMGNGSLSTLRIVTVCKAPGTAEALLAALRIPTGESITDNFNLSGVACHVDLKTGKCSKAVYKRGAYPTPILDNHPDTGEPIFGKMLPFLNESVELTVRAHDTLDFAWPIIGWDVAILEAGPVLIEANHMPGPEIVQMPSGIPLGATRYLDCLIPLMRENFGIGRT